MSKVLVDRELLERIARDDEGAASFADFEELKRVLAQPAEVEGVSNLHERVRPGVEAAPWVCKEIETLVAQLSAVTAELTAAAIAYRIRGDVIAELTAERDRLREEMAELWKRIDKFQSQSHGITALAEIERLRAEVGRYVPLHEAVQRAAGELPEGWAIQLYIERDGGGVELIGPDGTEDFDTNNERLDYTVTDALRAAMAAKEA